MSFNIRSSTHDFARIRRDHLLYVDKTHRVRAFLEWDDALLITRPRRFGKSLLLSTIKAMYSGTKSLFGPHDSGQEELAVYRDPYLDLAQACRVGIGYEYLDRGCRGYQHRIDRPGQHSGPGLGCVQGQSG